MKKICLLLLSFCSLLSASSLTITLSPDKTDYVITPKKSGTYWLIAYSSSKIPMGKQHFADLRLGNGPLLQRRLLGYNRLKANSRLERFQLKAQESCKLYFKYDQTTTEVSKLVFILQSPRKAPRAAAKYQPKLLPPAYHPRVLVNKDYLKTLRKKYNKGENLPAWKQVEKISRRPYKLKIDKNKETGYNSALLAAVQAKAFYYLVKEEKKTGREAIELITQYIRYVSFGNGQDICRKVGEMIYTASLVYDWCYDLLSEQEKTLIRNRMLFYAVELETSWPPFRQYPTVGHGNEAQFTRDLLTMAIAVYDEDPTPYKYIAYQLFEVWQPYKEFSHSSGRHSQGTSYGIYRTKFDFMALLQIYRTFGVKVFSKKVAELPYYWYYQRLPDGCFLIEGDDNWRSKRPQYMPINAMLLNCLLAVYPDPELKMEFNRTRYSKRNQIDPVLFLLTNDPDFKPKDRRSQLPLTKIYQDPLPGMTVRTGWDFTANSDDMVLSMNGGNLHFRNHQHGDLGAFQLFFREYLITDLGQYRYYGVPFDRLFNKTAMLHSMMRFYDPEQKQPEFKHSWLWANTGSQRTVDDLTPVTLKKLTTDPAFYCGETPRAGFGPSQQKPIYNFLECSLAQAYHQGVKSYTRTFVFWNHEQQDRPGTLLILDRFKTAGAHVKPIFQLTTFFEPIKQSGNVWQIRAKAKNKSGSVSIKPLIPEVFSLEILSGDKILTADGKKYSYPVAQKRVTEGKRMEYTGKGNVYLFMLQVHDGKLAMLPAECSQVNGRITVTHTDGKRNYLTNLGNVNKVTSQKFAFDVKHDNTHLLLLDLAPGKWQLVGKNKSLDIVVSKDKGSIYSVLAAGKWEVKPLKIQ